MCLILIAHKAVSDYPLIIIANRDEYHARPTAAACFWHDSPELLAGRDLRSGGTWLGITRSGRFAALTNYRDPYMDRSDLPSRGKLVTDYLLGKKSGAEFLNSLDTSSSVYNSYNIIVGDVDELQYYSNLGRGPEILSIGYHGLSNNFLNTPWPKVTTALTSLSDKIAKLTNPDPEPLLALLADQTPPPDHLLPDTGIGIDRERLLSPIFICNNIYGTRSSTVIFVDQNRMVYFFERSFNADCTYSKTVSFEFKLTS